MDLIKSLAIQLGNFLVFNVIYMKYLFINSEINLNMLYKNNTLFDFSPKYFKKIYMTF